MHLCVSARCKQPQELSVPCFVGRNKCISTRSGRIFASLGALWVVFFLRSSLAALILNDEKLDSKKPPLRNGESGFF